MPKRSHSNHPDHVRTTSSQPVQPTQTVDAPEAHHSGIPNPLQGTLDHLAITLRTCLLRDDGWLRIVPDGDGKVVWWKWKFTAGRYAGHYVMVRGIQDDHTESLTLLARKLASVDRGESRPTRDSYYDQG